MTKRKYLVGLAATVACIGVIGAALPHAADSPQPRQSDSFSAAQAAQSEQYVHSAIRALSASRPNIGMHIGSRSFGASQAAQAAQSVSGTYPIKALTPAQIQGLGGMLQQYKWTLTRTRTLQVVQWVRQNENLSQTAVIGGSALVCALIFVETVVGALPAAGACGFMVALEWANFKDAANRVTPRRPCLQVTLNQVPLFFGVSWLSFQARKCPRGK